MTSFSLKGKLVDGIKADNDVYNTVGKNTPLLRKLCCLLTCQSFIS